MEKSFGRLSQGRGPSPGRGSRPPTLALPLKGGGNGVSDWYCFNFIELLLPIFLGHEEVFWQVEPGEGAESGTRFETPHPCPPPQGGRGRRVGLVLFQFHRMSAFDFPRH